MGLPLLDGSTPRVTPPQASPFADLVAEVDRAAMECLGGVPVIYQPKVGAPVPVTGIFEEQFSLLSGAVQPGTETTKPAVFLRLEDLPTNPELDDPTIIIGGVSYQVTSAPRDGLGGIILVLREVM